MHLPHSKKHGITGPLSLKESSQDDIARTSSLHAFLVSSKIYDTDEEAIIRERVLGRLSYMFDNFIKAIGTKKGLADSDIRTATGHIYTFGSYRLGVHARGSDIDTLCVAPFYVDRKEFFEEFYMMLNDVFAEVEKVEDAYVPLMQLVYRECVDEGGTMSGGNKTNILDTAIDDIDDLRSCRVDERSKRIRVNERQAVDEHLKDGERNDTCIDRKCSDKDVVSTLMGQDRNGMLKRTCYGQDEKKKFTDVLNEKKERNDVLHEKEKFSDILHEKEELNNTKTVEIDEKDKPSSALLNRPGNKRGTGPGLNKKWWK